MGFIESIERVAHQKKQTIAFGLKECDQEIISSLQQAEEYAEIILVGPPAIQDIEGFEKIIDEQPEERLASMLAHDEVQGIIRGTIDDFKTYEAYQKLSGEKETINPGLFQDPFGREFFLSPASNPEGWAKEERFLIARQLADFVEDFVIHTKVAVFAAERHETYSRKKHIREGVVGMLNQTYEDAEWITSQLQDSGYEAENWSIDLNLAVAEGYNVLIPVNGMVGNQIMRVLLFCGGKILAAPRLGLSHCYEDNSRTEKDFSFHVKWLVGWINSKNK